MATTQQTKVIASHMVEFQDKFLDAPNEVAHFFIQHTAEAIEISIKAVEVHLQQKMEEPETPQTDRILGAPVCSFVVPATTEKFVAKNKFKVDSSRKAKVKISFLGKNFKEWFLGKTEDQFAGSTLSGRKLEKDSVDSSILAELGGDKAATTTLTELYAAMAAQAHGKDGDLLNDGWANIFYIEDINGRLRAVFVHWYDGGWSVDALSVGSPGVWDADSRAFSRNCLSA